MKTKISQFIPIILAILAIGFRYFSNWCIDSVSGCYGTLVSHISLSFTKPVFFFAIAFLPIAIILAFVSRTIFQSWLRLATWFVPLSILIIFITPVTSNSWMPIFFVSREDMAWATGGLFAVISLVLILWRYFSARRKPKF